VELKPYDPDAIEMTTFEPRQYQEEFSKATDWRFDPETGEIQFAYQNPDALERLSVYQPSLTEQVKALEIKSTEL